jgi:hypothetical protein
MNEHHERCELHPLHPFFGAQWAFCDCHERKALAVVEAWEREARAAHDAEFGPLTSCNDGCFICVLD